VADFVKDKKSLPNGLAALNRPALSVHIVRAGARLFGAKRYAMQGNAKFIFPVIISALIVFVVSAVVTFANIGLRADFIPRWLKAFMTGWPVAAVLAFFAIPYARRLTEAIVRLIEGQV
jgi:hypothetical protein